MSLIHRLHGAACAPLRQQLRRADGVRGVFTLKPMQRGELLLSLPLHYCYVTQLGPDLQHPPGWFSTPHGARQLRRWNRGVDLLPETWTWLQRYSCDAPSDVVSLTSTVSSSAGASPMNNTDKDSSSARGDSPMSTASPSLLSMTVSPVEAALATAVALRYFYATALHLTALTRTTKNIGPPPNPLADAFVRHLPLELYLRLGLESVYGDSAATGEAHLCLEQIAQNMRDAVLTHANMEEYRFLDEYPSLFDHLLLVCLYVVRARVLTMPLLSRGDRHDGQERVCSVFAPLLDGLNHEVAGPASAAVVVSLARQRLVVRATRDIRRGEEVTLNYRAAGSHTHAAHVPSGMINASSLAAHSQLYEMPMEDDWTTRYLMNEER